MSGRDNVMFGSCVLLWKSFWVTLSIMLIRKICLGEKPKTGRNWKKQRDVGQLVRKEEEKSG